MKNLFVILNIIGFFLVAANANAQDAKFQDSLWKAPASKLASTHFQAKYVHKSDEKCNIEVARFGDVIRINFSSGAKQVIKLDERGRISSVDTNGMTSTLHYSTIYTGELSHVTDSYGISHSLEQIKAHVSKRPKLDKSITKEKFDRAMKKYLCGDAHGILSVGMRPVDSEGIDPQFIEPEFWGEYFNEMFKPYPDRTWPNREYCDLDTCLDICDFDKNVGDIICGTGGALITIIGGGILGGVVGVAAAAACSAGNLANSNTCRTVCRNRDPRCG